MLTRKQIIETVTQAKERTRRRADLFLKTAHSFAFNSKGQIKFMAKYRECIKAIEQYDLILKEMEVYEK